MTILWEPSPAQIARANITRFASGVNAKFGVDVATYDRLWRWSVSNKDAFWRELWSFGNVLGDPGELVVQQPGKMPGAQWFPQARLNFAQNLLERRRADDASDALVFWGEDKVRRRVSHADLHMLSSRVAAALTAHGIAPGDRVAALMPNIPESVIAMLGATARGAIFSSCSPEYGVECVVDRFAQIAPRVLFVADGYWYNGRALQVMDKVREIVAALPSVERVIVVPYLQQPSECCADLSTIRGAVAWDAWLAPFLPGPIDYVSLPFAHPLYILYTSGTTGVPKCIVHSAGGTLLQHLKEHLLHGDTRPGDRVFYFTTCGWTMWNWLVSALATGATLLLFDGSPNVNRGRILWEFADAERMTHFGTSARFIDAQRKIALVPRKDFQLTALRIMYSTGSPLSPANFDYVYQCVKGDLMLASIAGGTDIISCFILGVPTLPVRRGEVQARGLGMDVDVFDERGAPIRDEKGELVCKSAFPSMPLGFWGDPQGMQFSAAYFERFPGVWCHGDWVALTAHDGMIIYGRSDATLNAGGVRMGTAEIYRQVETMPEILESLAIGQDWPPGEEGDVRIVLFVRLREGVVLDAALTEAIKQRVRVNTTPRHVPAKIVAVTDIPRTRSGKIVELAVREVVHGHAVKNANALINPEALEQFRDLPELKV